MIPEFLTQNCIRRLGIWVVGDAMIDDYFNVTVNRISPECSLPILHSSTDPIRRPGGAGNVAYQMKHFNVELKLVSHLNYDALDLYQEHGISSRSLSMMCGVKDFSNPVKQRFLSNGVQVSRIDTETERYGLSEEDAVSFEALICDKMKEHQFPDVAIFSDYNKGFFQNPQQWLELLKGKSLTFVDPKKGPVEKWKGCTLFKPNAKEAEELSGFKDWKKQCLFFHETLECNYVVITQGGSGVVAYDGTEFIEYFPKNNILVESVIGAGDCFMAMLAMAMGHGFSLRDSVTLAYDAGVLYVQKRFNRPVVPAELARNKIVNAYDLKNRDFKLVFTNGCFDILHKGHLEILKVAKSKGDKVVVAINADASVKRLKGETRPIVGQNTRAAVLAAMENVDFVVIFNEDTPLEAILACKPDVLVKGGDYSLNDIVGADIVEEVVVVPLVPDISTTKILQKSGLDRA
jgi:D-beta-D-heptose 7-phosphate kinase/D-beta-D-heptose 1-phosphate adenosyltransferase